MGCSKYMIIALIVVLAGTLAAEQQPPAASGANAAAGSPAGRPHGDAEAVNLMGQRSELMRQIQGLELDLAGIAARRRGLQEQSAMIRDEAGRQWGGDAVTQELQRLLAAGERNLSQLRQAAAAGRVSEMEVTRAQESVARARIDLARRREELTRLAGGGPLEEFTRESNRLAVDQAEKEARLQVVRRQHDEVQTQLTRAAPLPPRTDAEAVNLGGQKDELARRAQVLELDLAGIDARRKALQAEIAVIRDEAAKRLDADVITQELRRLLAASEEALPPIKQAVEAGQVPMVELARAQESVAKARIDLARRQEELAHSAGGGQLQEFLRELSRLAIDQMGKEAQLQTVRRQLDDVQEQLAQLAPLPPRTDADTVNLGGQRSELTRRAQVLELDLAGLGARRRALQEQIARLRDEADQRLGADVVTRELERLLATSEENLEQTKKVVAAGRTSLVELIRAQEVVAQARINRVRRREELTRLTGGGQLEEFTRDLSRRTIDQAEKEAQLQVVRRQLEQVQEQLTRVHAS